MRAREQYVAGDPASFGEPELLALALGTGVSGRSALEVAASVLMRFGSLRAVADAPAAALAEVPGVGPARAIRVHAALQAGRRSLRQPADVEVVSSPAAAFALLGPPLRALPEEELHAIYLDRRQRLLGRRALTRGSDAFTVVDPRQVFRPAIAWRASAVILAHNHPSGDPEPSRQDLDVTHRVAEAGRVLGVRLQDHLVVGDVSWVSMSERGALPHYAPGPLWIP